MHADEIEEKIRHVKEKRDDKDMNKN